MAKMNLGINFDLSTKLSMMQVVNKTVFPLLAQAVNAVGQQTAANWQEAVYGAKLWSGEKDAYAQSIKWTMTGDFSGEVVATYKYAEEIENGRPARDLKKMLNTSLKVRVSKKGNRFLYIPFRHNTPGNDAHGPAMPADIYDLARTMEASMVTGQTTRESGLNAMDIKTQAFLTVPQNTYSWGAKLVTGQAGMKNYNNMYRFDTSTPGGAQSSQYLTFRTMSEKSKGWITKPQPGQKIAEGVANDMRPKANQAFAMAIKKTLARK